MSAFVQYTLQGLAAGGFYALAALGLAVIFAVLGVVNFSHGACYMLGAVTTAVLLDVLGVSFWVALVVVPILLFLVGVLMERLFVRWLLRLDPLYNFLLTFGLSLILIDVVKRRYGVSGLPMKCGGAEGPAAHRRPRPLGLSGVRLPLLVPHLRTGLAAAHQDPGRHDRARGHRGRRAHPRAGHQRGRWVTPVFGFGIALAGLAGRAGRAVPGDHRRHGQQLRHHPVRVVVIGGLGSILGAVVAGFLVGLVEAYGQAYAPTFAQVPSSC
jgi:branched-chain amino acid transport system permease protein